MRPSQDLFPTTTTNGQPLSTTELLAQAREMRSVTRGRMAARLRRRLGAALTRLLHPTHAPAR